jgi:hypothetical protein
MERSHEYKRSGSLGMPSQKFDKLVPGCEPEFDSSTLPLPLAPMSFSKLVPDSEPEGYSAAERSTEKGRMQRSTGILMSGVLIIGLLALAVFAAPATGRAASISVGLSVGFAPPPVPVYTQPVCPGPGYMWTPGYWAYDPANGYFWVPGTWVVAPALGLLWTPGYWGWGGAAFIWHAGYWGPHVGFYGGINYGFGYLGVGYAGGYWRGGAFFYNRSVNNLGGAHITNVYSRTVVNNFAANRVSYNGGAGGLRARPTAGELATEHDRHIEATSMQKQHEMAAHNERAQYASVNHGRPDVAATGRPGEFRGSNVGRATRAGGPVNPSGNHGTNRVMTARSKSPSSHSSGTRQAGTRPAQSRSAYSARNASHGQSPSRPAASRRPRSTSAHNAARGRATALHAENRQRQPQPRRSQPSEKVHSEQRR